MKVQAIKTHAVKPSESITDILDQHLKHLNEGIVVALTSKIISLCQNRIIKQGTIDKKSLIKQEADAYLDEENPYDLVITLKEKLMLPSAGIDECNSDGLYILYPKNVQKTAENIWRHLREKHQIENLGIIITDSHTTPLRRGVTGITLGWCGFEALHNYIGKPDIFGNPLRVTQINILDALAASAVFVMGEGAEQTPIALIESAPKIQFSSKAPTLEEISETQIPLEEDIYANLLKSAAWVTAET